MNADFMTAKDARSQSQVSTPTIHNEIVVLQGAVLAAVQSGRLNATVGSPDDSLASTMTSDTAYFDAWLEPGIDLVRDMQMVAVVQYFSDLGYSIVRKTNLSNTTFFWEIAW